MSSVYSIRIPKKLKQDIEEIDNVDWTRETRAFLEKKVRKSRISAQLAKARELRQKSRKALSAGEIVREDRRLGH